MCNLPRLGALHTREVLPVALSVIGDQLAHLWNHIHRVCIIKVLEHRRVDRRKLQTQKAASPFENPVGLGECSITVCNVADSESNGVAVHRVAFEGQLLS